MIEALESRIAPAAVFTFTAADNDVIKVSVSKGTLSDLTTATHHSGNDISLLDLSQATWGTEFAGATVSVTVSHRGPAPADGLINVGEIDATGIDLGAVSVKGDLGKIVAGSAPTTVSAKSLTVNSLGLLGTSTGAPDLLDTFAGGLGPLHVHGDVVGVDLNVSGAMGSITIGGSLIGAGTTDSGSLNGFKTGPVKIGGDILGGGGEGSGDISFEKTSSFVLGGSIIGGGGDNSGYVGLSSPLVKIGGSVRGGSSSNTGVLHIDEGGTVTVMGGVLGGANIGAGTISGDTITHLTIDGSVVGGTTANSGGFSLDTVGTLKIGGSVTGGGGASSGMLSINQAKSITIGGSLLGDTFASTGTIEGVALGSIKIGGSLLGGTGATSGSITSTTLGAISIGGGVSGASILASGNTAPQTLSAALAIKSLTVGGSVVNSQIVAGNFTNADVQIGRVAVHGDWFASNLVVGAENLGNDDDNGGTGQATDNMNFGDSHDHALVNATAFPARIAAVAIAGQVQGLVTSLGGPPLPHYGFVTEEIGSFTLGGFVIPLTAGSGNDDRALGNSGEVAIHEV